MWDLRATVAPRRFLGARAVATPAESQAKQSTETGRACALVVGEKAMFRQLTNGLINGIFESLNDGPAVVLRLSESWVIRTRERVLGMGRLFDLGQPFACKRFSGKEPRRHFL